MVKKDPFGENLRRSQAKEDPEIPIFHLHHILETAHKQPVLKKNLHCFHRQETSLRQQAHRCPAVWLIVQPWLLPQFLHLAMLTYPFPLMQYLK